MGVRGARLNVGTRRCVPEMVSVRLWWRMGLERRRVALGPRWARLVVGTRRGALEMVSVWLEWPTGVVVGARRWGFGARG